MLYSICQQIWKTQQWLQDWKSQFSSQSQRKAIPKKAQIITQLHFFYMPARLCSKSFKLGFSSTWTENFQMYMLDLERAEEPEIKLPTSIGTYKKEGNSKKTSTSGSLTMVMPMIVWIKTNCGIFLIRWECQTTLPASWETYMQDKQQQLQLDMEQWTGSKLEKEYINAVYCHPA